MKQDLSESLRPVKMENVVRRRYMSGQVRARDGKAYRDSAGVSDESITETYIALKLEADDWRWPSVPFCLRAGKCMTGRRTEVVHFK